MSGGRTCMQCLARQCEKRSARMSLRGDQWILVCSVFCAALYDRRFPERVSPWEPVKDGPA